MGIRRIAFELHKILGLATGVVVFVVALTGCCWVFREEVLAVVEAPLPVQASNAPRIGPSQARELALQVYPGRSIHGILFPTAADAPVEVIFYEADPEFYHSLYLDPYSGRVLRDTDQLAGFFAFVLKGHMRLWLPKAIGEQVVGVSILLFLLLLLTGLVLWLPKKRKHLRRRMSFIWKPGTRWKRKNFDLHSILGFYVCLGALLIGFTGSVMSYQWLRESVHTALGGEKSAVFALPLNAAVPGTRAGTGTVARLGPSDPSPGRLAPEDRLLQRLRLENPNAASFEIHLPPSEEASIYVETSYEDGIYYNNDYRFFDANTLEELESPSLYGRYEDATTPDKILRMNYDIHVGAIGGLPGKVLAFCISLLVASLPVTGTLIWVGRRFKGR